MKCSALRRDRRGDEMQRRKNRVRGARTRGYIACGGMEANKEEACDLGAKMDDRRTAAVERLLLKFPPGLLLLRIEKAARRSPANMEISHHHEQSTLEVDGRTSPTLTQGEADAYSSGWPSGLQSGFSGPEGLGGPALAEDAAPVHTHSGLGRLVLLGCTVPRAGDDP
jgi:hypothetical protein